MKDLKNILDEVTTFIKFHGDRVFDHWQELTIDASKDGVDVTTNFDIEIEKKFAEFVKEHYPDHGFVGEEDQELNRTAEYIWHIDPIDGSKFFAKYVPLWGLTLALVKDGEPLVGVIYNPVSKQLYSAYKGGGAFLNDAPLKVPAEKDPAKLQMVWDLTTWKYEWEKYQDQFASMLGVLIKKFYRVRALGNGAYSLAWQAQGMFGAFVDPYRHASKFVDIAAGVLITQEAGATFYRHPLGNDMEQIIVASPEIIELVKPIIKLDQA